MAMSVPLTSVSGKFRPTGWPDAATQERTRAALLESLPAELRAYEQRFGVESAAIEAAMTAGTLPDTPETCEWAILYDFYQRIGGDGR